MEDNTHRDFNLGKVNFPKAGLKASYQITITDGEEVNVMDFKDVAYTFEPSQDLLKLKEELKVPLIYTLGIDQGIINGLKMANPKIKKEELEEKTKELFAKMCESIRVYGVSFGGEGQAAYVIITGGIESQNGISTINSARIFLAQSKLGYEEELENVVRLLQAEVYNYFLKNKQAQYTLFTPEPEAGKIEEKASA